ncbi:hypothetical protein [Streptomyces sp. NPDC053367]|uniref:hypothetical protein n=1 Tax=Streptomyces sp. NPDC053367 TaxID=3365700 RepID=UPI0037D4B802
MTPHDHKPNRLVGRYGGAMVGLFWITPETVHLGAPPATTPSAVALTPEGLVTVGPREAFLPWRDIASVRVEDVPARTSARRTLVRALEVVLGPQSPTEMTVAVTVADGSRLAVPVHSAAASAYTLREAELSQRLLDLFVQEKTSPAVLTHWLTTTGIPRPPRQADREALLHRWTEHI